MNGKEFVTVAKATFSEFNKDDVATMAAAVTYYAFFSLFPLLILAITIATQFTDRATATTFILNNVERVLPGSGAPLADILTNIFENRDNAGWIALGGFAILIFSAAGSFEALDKAINRAWKSEKAPSFLVTKLTSFVMMGAIALLLIASFVVTTALTTTRTATTAFVGDIPGDQVFWQIVSFAGSAALIFVALLLMYRFLPRRDINLRDVWLAALLAAIAWSLVKEGFAYYLGSSFANYEAVYGTLGTIVAILTWIYISSIIILIGAEFAAETARVRRLRQKIEGTQEAEEKSDRKGSPWLPLHNE